MADDIVIRVAGEDTASPVLREIATSLEAMATGMDLLGTSAQAMAGIFTEAIGRAATAMGEMGAVAGMTSDSMGVLSDAFVLMAGAMDADSARFVADTTEMIAALNTLSSTTASASDALGITGDAIARLSAVLPALSAAFTNLDAAIADSSSVESGMVTALNEIGAALAAQGVAVDEEVSKLADYAQAGGSVTVSNNDFRTAVSGANQVVTDSLSILDAARTRLAELQAAADASGTANTQLTTALNDMDAAMQTASSDLTDLAVTLSTGERNARLAARAFTEASDAMTSLMEPATQALDAEFGALAQTISMSADQIILRAKAMADEFAITASSFGDNTVAVESLRAAMASGSTELALLNNMSSALATQLTALRTEITITSNATVNLGTAAGDLVLRQAAVNSQIAESINVDQALAQTYVDVADKAKQVASAMVALRANFDTSALAAQKMAAANVVVRDSLQGVADRAASDAPTIASDVEQVGGAFAGARGFAAGFLETVGSQWMNLLLLGTAAIAAGRGVLQAGVDFQQQIAVIKNLAATSVDVKYGIGNITKQLIQDAPAWGQTPAALAQGLYYVMSAGFHGADAMAILQASAYGASGGLGSMKDVASGVTTILVDYGLKGKDAAAATGYMIDAVIAGKTTIDDFSKNVGKFLPTAASFGYTITDVSAAFDTMTRAGISSAQSSTFLRSMLIRLGAQEVTVADAAQKMGINVDAGTLQMLKQQHPADALRYQLQYLREQIDAAAKSHGNAAQQTAWANDAFTKLVGGIRSGTGAVMISNQQFAAYNQILGQLGSNNVGDLLAQHFHAMQQTIAFSMQAAKGAIASFGAQFIVTFGPQIQGIIKAVTATIQRLTSYLQNNPQGFSNAMKLVGGVIAAISGSVLGAAFLNFTHLTDLIRGGNIPALKNLSSLFGGLGKVGTDAQTGLKAVSEGGSGLLGVFQKLTVNGGNLGDILGGKVAGGLKNLIQPQIGVKGAFVNSLGAIRDFVTNGIGSTLFGALKGGLDGFFRITGGVKSFFGVLKSMTSLQGFVGVMQSVIPAVLSFGGAMMSALLPILLIAGAIAVLVIAFIYFRPQVMAVGKVLLSALGPTIHNVMGMVKQFVGVIQKDWATAMVQIRPAMMQLFAALKQATPVVQVLGVVFQFVAAVILGVLSGLVHGFLSALPAIIGVFTGIVTFITGVFNIIKGIFTGNGNAIKQGFGQVFGGLYQIVVNAFAAVLNFVGQGVRGILAWFNNLTHGALNPVLHMVDGIIHFFQGLFDKLVGHSIVPDMVKGIITHMLMLPAQIIGMIAKFVADVLTEFIQLGVRGQAAFQLLVQLVLSNIHTLVVTVPLRIEQMVLQSIANFIQFVIRLQAEGRLLLSVLLAVFTSLVSQGVGKFKSLVSQIVSSVTSLPGKLSDVGHNMMNALVSAIQNGASNVLKAMANMAQNAINAAKNALGIHSPSKVFDEIGRNTGEGMAQGITNSAGRIKAAATKAFGASNLPVGKPDATGSGIGSAAMAYGAGGKGGPGGAGGAAQITLNLGGGLGAGLQLLNPSDRRRFAHQVAAELSGMSSLQGIMPIGYSGRGTI